MAERIIDFEKYCQTCAYKDVDEADDPCRVCLEYGGREDSHKPVMHKDNSDSQKKHD